MNGAHCRQNRFSVYWLGGWLMAAACFSPHAAPAQNAADPHSATATASDENDEISPYQNGLIAQYTGLAGEPCTRLEDQVAFGWGEHPPDRRIAPGPFSAVFSGQLLVQIPGVYRFRAFAAGTVRIELGGKLLLDRASTEPTWLDSEAIELPFGYHPLEVQYRRADERGRLALFWEGPRFQLEPIPGRWLFHQAKDTPSDDFERGEQWARALRCTACHSLPGEPVALLAPALDHLAGNLSRDWLMDWLADASANAKAAAISRPIRRMPHFGLDRSKAEAIADYLLTPSKTPERTQTSSPTPGATPLQPHAARGGTLFRSVGCLACHRVGELGTDGLFGGGDLSTIASKRPRGFFATWLVDPAALNHDHRMPVFALTKAETLDLSEYLQTLGVPATAGPPSLVTRVDEGRRLVEQFNCSQCHALPGGAAPGNRPLRRLPLSGFQLDGARSTCLSEPDSMTRRPGYRLSEPQRQAVTAFMIGIGHSSNVAASARGETLLVERNCLSCHARGTSRGLAPQLPAIAETDRTLRDVLPALAPPALFGVGDKLHDQALAASITVSEPPRQIWLRVRMPKFSLLPEETSLLVDHLIEADRIPDRPGDLIPSGGTVAKDSALEAAGAKLVTASGFGCTSCHAIGKWKPQKVAVNAEGASLSLIGQRVRHTWFNRWVRNPARIVPQMEMPAVQQPARGVLDANLDQQVAAVWQILNRKGFTPPNPDALRIVHRANDPGLIESAAVLTDTIEIEGQRFIKPLVMGLANRHNLLFDLAASRLAAWWLGDTASERTRGKSWYWEAGSPQLLATGERVTTAKEPEISFLRDGARFLPAPADQYISEFDYLEHIADGVKFAQRLHFHVEGLPTVLRVVQEFTSLPAGAETGFRRRLDIEGVPAGFQIEWLALSGQLALDHDRRSAGMPSPVGRLHVTIRSPTESYLKTDTRGAHVVLAPGTRQNVVCELHYQAAAQPAPTTVGADLTRTASLQELAVVPGFEAIRLGVSDRAMPTGLAWRADGTLVVSSLEGRVWLGHDHDGDGLEDELVPFSDDLAAPYGVAANGDAIDVINKYGLLRLYDRDGNGHADRTELLASGWGHTLDYHDWAIGLPRDNQGNYYISFPCQQDNRSEQAAHLRGSVVKLIPRKPTIDDPRQFTIEPLAAGLRFPQGIALSRSGDLFVTDNQGNYTPFNELNHIVKDARYGFINRLESKRGLNPPFQPAAIEIPHPWTRSVNGICFLEPPAGMTGSESLDLYGPFAGQLIGCEYDTRRLVRMSLERVGDGYQGAVYPFSLEPAVGAETFEGPLVCQVAPNGDLYVGNIRDSGWGAGSNTGSLVRLRRRGDLPSGIAQIRVDRQGFVVEFTHPIKAAQAAEKTNYAVSSYRRTPTPDYGGPDQDRRVEEVQSVWVSPDGKQATLKLAELREGFVYEFHVRNLAAGPSFFPSEAYYTLRHRLP